jgi:L-fuconolactonase
MDSGTHDLTERNEQRSKQRVWERYEKPRVLASRQWVTTIMNRIRAVDAHHHLWEKTEYSHFSPYLTRQYVEDISGAPCVSASVYVDCHAAYYESGPEHLRCVGETVFANRLAEQSANRNETLRLCAAIVPSADFRRGAEVEEVLQAHLRASSRVRGVRQCTIWDSDAALRYSVLNNSQRMMADHSFSKGFAKLRDLSLSFDAWLYHTQIDELADLAQAFSDVPIVLDHIGGPIGIGAYADQKEVVYRDWKRSIDNLATCANVCIKLGGLNMPLSGVNWSVGRDLLTSEEIVEKTRHFYLYAIDRFRPDRCMFESNFPVDKHTCSYGALWGAFDLLTKDFSHSEREDMFAGTATRFYRLDQGSSAGEWRVR